MKFLLIARRDLSAYLSGMYGYVVIAVLLLVTGGLFNFAVLNTSAQYSSDVLQGFFMFSAFTTAFAAWLLSMRSIAEEKQMRTELVLHTSPISEGQIVFGKYLAVMGMICIYIALTLHMPAMILVNGKVSLAQIAVGYGGLLLYGSAVGAIGVFASSLVKSQVLAAVISGFIVAMLILLWMASKANSGAFADIMAYGAFYDKHFLPFKSGMLSLNHVVYYVTITWLFLLLATRSLARRRWQ